MTDFADNRPAFYKDRSAIVEITVLAHTAAARNLATAFELIVNHPMTKDFKTHRAARPLHAVVNILKAYSVAIHTHQPQKSLETFLDALTHIHETIEVPQ